jgi:hypothetical protein
MAFLLQFDYRASERPQIATKAPFGHVRNVLCWYGFLQNLFAKNSKRFVINAPVHQRVSLSVPLCDAD